MVPRFTKSVILDKNGVNMYKKSASVSEISSKSFSIFISRFQEFFKLLLYPVLGQFAGIFLCFLPISVSSGNAPNIFLLIIFLIAGLTLFCHAFWKYLLAMGAMVLAADKIVENEPVREFNYYMKAFDERSREYVEYLLIMCLISIVPVAAFAILIAQYAGSNPFPDISAVADPVVFYQYILSFISSKSFLITFGAMLILAPLFSTLCLPSFVLNKRLTAFQAIKKAVKLSFINYFSNYGLLILAGFIFFVTALILELVFSAIQVVVANVSILKAVASILSYMLQSVLIAYWIIATTWWYLRLEKEESAKAVYGKN